MNSTTQEYFRIIRQSIENNKLVVFAGSAVSYDSNLPSWNNLISEMKSSNEKVGDHEYLKIAEQYYVDYGHHSYYKKIKSFFPRGSKPNKIHELIISLKPNHIITTNWDDLLEKALSEKGALYFPVSTDHELASSPISNLLIKMHGDLTHKNIVFKESDYLSYSENFPLIENFIKSIFSTHIVIFIGYSINDYNLNQILSWVRNRTIEAPPIFSIITEKDIHQSEINYLRRKGVFPILSTEVSRPEKYPGLSERSRKAAQTIDKILMDEENTEIESLEIIKNNISAWEIVYPPFFVQMIKDVYNIISVNKVYYDPSKNSVNYHLNNDKSLTRSEYRSVRNILKSLLKHVPITEICIHINPERHIKIKNNNSFKFIDEYTTFNFTEIHKRISTVRIGFSQTLDEENQYAFDTYFVRRLISSRETFLTLSNLYFSRSQFVRSLICAFNRRNLCLGEVSWKTFNEFSRFAMEDLLTKNDAISETVDRFPKKVLGHQKALIQYLDANNSFFLLLIKEIFNLSKKIEEMLKEKRSTTKSRNSSFRDFSSIRTYIKWMILFLNKNRIVSVHNPDYKSILRVAFESMLTGRFYKENIDNVFLYSAIASYNHKDLYKKLSQSLEEEDSLFLDQEAIEYCLSVLDNCLLSDPDDLYREPFASNAWSNAIILLSFARHNINHLTDITDRLHKAILANKMDIFTDPINIFLVTQHNKYKNMIDPIILNKLLEAQIEKITAKPLKPTFDDRNLFSNLAHLAKNAASDDFVFDNVRPLSNFVSELSLKPIKERIGDIEGFVYTIYSLSSGQLKRSVKQMLVKTFSELKKLEFNETYVIFGLNLYFLEVLKSTDLKFVLRKLKMLVENQRGASSQYMTINDQLSRLERIATEGFEPTIDKVSKAAERCHEFFRKYE